MGTSVAGGMLAVYPLGWLSDRVGRARLLAAVRRTHPDAYILYKPHPDVVSGNRRGDSRQDGKVSR